MQAESLIERRFDTLCGPEGVCTKTLVIDVHIEHLRSKLEGRSAEPPIVTVPEWLYIASVLTVITFLTLPQREDKKPRPGGEGRVTEDS
jgi:hypothetical protein